MVDSWVCARGWVLGPPRWRTEIVDTLRELACRGGAGDGIVQVRKGGSLLAGPRHRGVSAVERRMGRAGGGVWGK